jgi:hypothetical protein
VRESLPWVPRVPRAEPANLGESWEGKHIQVESKSGRDNEEKSMLRRFASLGFTFAFALAALLVACGHQVTPSPSTSNLSGHMVIRFRTVQTMDFTNYNYVIVFNTCGVGGEPYPNAYATTFLNYSTAFVFGASTGSAAAYPLLYQYVITSGTVPTQILVPLGASTTQLVLNDNGQGNEFQLTFTRNQLDNPLQVSNPCPAGTPAPGTSSSPVGAVSPSPSPSVSPSASPSPGPSSSPAGTPPSGVTEFWYVNFFTIDRSGKVQDSLGVGGATDNSYVLQVDTATTGSYVLTRPAGAILPSNQSAAIAGGEIDNYP